MTEAIKIFEYKKTNDGYWDRAKLYQQVVIKALPIAEALYPYYSLVFLFDNATNHFVYVNDALCTRDMNKSLGGKQLYLHNGWYRENDVDKIHPINIQESNET